MKKLTILLFASIICLGFTLKTTACTFMETNPGGADFLLDFDWWIEPTLNPNEYEIMIDIWTADGGGSDAGENLKKVEIFDHCGNMLHDSYPESYKFTLNECESETFFIRVTDKTDLYATVSVSESENCPPDFDFWIEQYTNIGDKGVITTDVDVNIDAWDQDNDYLTSNIYMGTDLLNSVYGCCGASHYLANVAKGDYTFTAEVTDGRSVPLTQIITETVVDQFSHEDAPDYFFINNQTQCEYYDYGGPGIAYNDLDEDNGDQTLRPTEDVDIYNATDNNGNAVTGIGWVKAGEWWEYTIHVGSSDEVGNYFLRLKAATPNANKRIKVKVDGNAVSTLTFSKTGGWHTYKFNKTSNFHLSRGEHVIKLKALDSGINLDWFVIKPAGKSAKDDLIETEITHYPNPVNDYLYVNVNTENIQSLMITDIAGRAITGFSETRTENQIRFDFDNSVTSGIYLVTIKYNNEIKSFRILKN